MFDLKSDDDYKTEINLKYLLHCLQWSGKVLTENLKGEK